MGPQSLIWFSLTDLAEPLPPSGLLKKFEGDHRVINEIQTWLSTKDSDHEVDYSRCPAVDENERRKYQYYYEDFEHNKKKYTACKEQAKEVWKCFDEAVSFIKTTLLVVRKGREIMGNVDVNEQLTWLESAMSCAETYLSNHEGEGGALLDSSFRSLAVELCINMGILEKRRDDINQARLYFNKALDIDSKRREAKYHLSQLRDTTQPNSHALSKAQEQPQQVADKNTISNNHTGRAVVCCIAMDEEPYIDEFVDYHLGLGFGKIIIYDNTNAFQLKQWGQRRGDGVELIHFPGINKQSDAYWNCAKNTLEGKHGDDKLWAAFWDVDEFLVLKKHDNVDDFLDEHLSSGALGVNWLLFGPSGQTVYKPLPVTKRFVYRENETNLHIKSIVRLSDMNLTEAPHVHYPTLPMLNGDQHDTNGKVFKGAFSEYISLKICLMSYAYCTLTNSLNIIRCGWTYRHSCLASLYDKVL